MYHILFLLSNQITSNIIKYLEHSLMKRDNLWLMHIFGQEHNNNENILLHITIQ